MKPAFRKLSLGSIFAITTALLLPSVSAQDGTSLPKVGDVARDFELPILGGNAKLSLQQVLAKQPVVLIVLRGYPGYQCPICSRQVGGLIQKSEDIARLGAKVVLIYPGLGDELEMRANEFFARQQLPDNFSVVTDPDYKFTNAWHLRWDAPRETAYPSTFVIGTDEKISFAKISKTHGDRSNPSDVVTALTKLKSGTN